MPSTPTTGNAIVVVLKSEWGISTGISDGTNTYELVSQAYNGDVNKIVSIYVAKNITGTATDITISFGVSSGYHQTIAIEYSGFAADPIDATASGGLFDDTGTTDVATNAFSTAQAGELVIVAAVPSATATFTAGTDFTLIDGNVESMQSLGVEEYGVGGTLSSYVAHMTSSATLNFSIAWASFKLV